MAYPDGVKVKRLRPGEYSVQCGTRQAVVAKGDQGWYASNGSLARGETLKECLTRFRDERLPGTPPPAPRIRAKKTSGPPPIEGPKSKRPLPPGAREPLGPILTSANGRVYDHNRFAEVRPDGEVPARPHYMPDFFDPAMIDENSHPGDRQWSPLGVLDLLFHRQCLVGENAELVRATLERHLSDRPAYWTQERFDRTERTPCPTTTKTPPFSPTQPPSLRPTT